MASLGAVIFSNGVPSARCLCGQEPRLDNEDNVNAEDKPPRSRVGSLTANVSANVCNLDYYSMFIQGRN